MLRLVRGGGPETERESTTTVPDPLGPLTAAAANGDVHAARTLLIAVAPTIFCAVRGVLGTAHPDLEDVAQDVALALLQSLPAFRGECSLRHYASRIAVRRALNARRQSGFRARWAGDSALDEDATLYEGGATPTEVIAAGRRWRTMFALLHSIPEPQEEALVLHFILGHTVEEIAEMVSTPVNTVRSRLRVAKETLRAKIKDEQEFVDWREGEA
jgi:RNA polymerase sigma factor (sigma-70 family)